MMNYSQLRQIIFVLLIIIKFTSCRDEAVPIEDANCEIAAFKSSLDIKEDLGLFIINIREEGDLYEVSFDDGSSISICTEVIKRYRFLLGDWELEFTFNDETTYTTHSKGDVEISTQLDPYGRNPLCAIATVTGKRNGKVKINIRSKHGEESDLIHEFDEIGSMLEVPIFGLFQDYMNEVELTFLAQNNEIIDIDTLFIQTEKVMSIDPSIEIIKRDKENMEPGDFHLVSSLSYWGPNVTYMFDVYGEIRWLINYRESEVLDNLFFDVGVEQLQNGNLYFGDKRSNAIYEVDFFGTIIDRWPLTEYTFHHHVQEKPNGNFLMTTNLPESVHNNGNGTKEDYIIEIDRTTKEIVKVWDFKKILDEDRTALGEWTQDDPVDWIHINAVVYSESDNTIIASGRNQGVIKVDYNDNVKWILAPHEGWGDNRIGQDCNGFLLTATSLSNEPYDDNVQNGFSNATDFEWPWYQHAPSLLPNGNLILFDNGWSRNFDSTLDRYSRAVEFDIDEENMSVSQKWQYGKERGLDTYADVLSDVDYLPKTGNILFSPGYKVSNPENVDGGRIIEVDYNTKEVYFEAFIGSPGLTFHRVERMSFY